MNRFWGFVILILGFFQPLSASGWSDPVIAYGPLRQVARQIEVDPAGNVYVAGIFEEKMFLGNDTLYSRHGKSAFLTRFDQTGKLSWFRTAEIKEGEDCQAICLDDEGNVFWAASWWESVDVGGEFLQARQTVSLFLTKWTAEGDPVFAKTIAETQYLKPWFGGAPELKVDLCAYPGGGVCLAGSWREGGMIAGDSAVAKGEQDAFLLRLDASGNSIWSKTAFGGGGNEWSGEVLADSAGNVFWAGRFDQEFRMGPFRLRTEEQGSYFLAKFDPQGNLLWADEMGGAKGASHATLALSKSGGPALSGGFSISRFLRFHDALGHRQQTVRGNGRFAVNAMEFLPDGNLVVAGWFSEVLDIERDGEFVLGQGGRDIFLAKISPQGEILEVETAGGDYFDNIFDLSVTEKGEIWLAGQFRGELQLGNHLLQGKDNTELFWARFSFSD